MRVRGRQVCRLTYALIWAGDSSTMIANWSGNICSGTRFEYSCQCLRWSIQAAAFQFPALAHSRTVTSNESFPSLGPERLKALTIHHGRHTFISHALAGGRTLAEVRDAAGHSNVSITSAYLHVAVDEGHTMGGLFSFTG